MNFKGMSQKDLIDKEHALAIELMKLRAFMKERYKP